MASTHAHQPAAKSSESGSEFQVFEGAMRQILSVPKKAIAGKLAHKKQGRKKSGK